jgi:hypothetical protein
VSNFDDNQDYPKTLPSPELNPLTNPVLGRNMGRWAEVYFTSPPEKREQAVQELLRELQRDSSAGESSAPAMAVPSEPGQAAEESRTFPSSDTLANLPVHYPTNFPEDSSAATNSETAASAFRKNLDVSPGLAAPLREEFIQCRSCGHLALVEQKFCGACGSALPVRESGPDATPGNGAGEHVPAAPEPGLELAAQSDRVGEEELAEDSTIGEEKFAGLKDGQKDDQKIDVLPTPTDSLLHDRQLIWAQGVKPITDEVPRLFLEQQRARQRRSRWLMGAALALLVGILFYVGAHGTVAWLRAHDVAQNAAVKGDSAAGRASSSLSGGSGGASSGGSSSAGSALPAQTAKRDDVTPAVVVHALSPKPAGYSATRRDDERNPAGAGASTQTSYAPASAADRHALSDRSLGDHALGDHALGDHSLADHVLADLGGHGAEELAIAESFLSGTQGKARDSSEAAQWLWKAVGKENAAAALLLSDLYVTGDGVPRNCDQARLLLDAAASRGVPGAGERIRDLPNLGCE